MFEHITLIGFFTTALAGFITAFLPCTYPMLIGYIAFLAGTGAERGHTAHALKTTLWFSFGFTATYIVFGTAAGLFGQFSQTTLIVHSVKPILLTIGAVFFIIIGLVLVQALPLPNKLRGIRSIPLPKWLSARTWWGAAGIGAIFAAGWSPCIGPVLGGVLVLATASGSFVAGALLLGVFSLGLTAPLLVLAVLYGRAAKLLKRAEKLIPIMRVAGGILFIVLGISFIIGDFSFLGSIRPPAFFHQYI